MLNEEHDRLLREAYVPTTAFYRGGEGPLLGMAMAISGAAAQPEHGPGDQSGVGLPADGLQRATRLVGRATPGTASRRPTPGPPFGLTYTARELIGSTDDEQPYVNLSDGGHFDNLGVYELIRRGCRYIIVCDAGQDGEFTFQDLGEPRPPVPHRLRRGDRHLARPHPGS